MELVEKDGNIGWVNYNGVKTKVSLALLDDVEPGQWVMVHAGYAIETMSPEEAAETLDMIREALE